MKIIHSLHSCIFVDSEILRNYTKYSKRIKCSITLHYIWRVGEIILLFTFGKNDSYIAEMDTLDLICENISKNICILISEIDHPYLASPFLP